MEEYTVITQGNAIYLEGKLGDEEQLDEVDRGMLVSNQIAGFLPLSVQWVNGNCRLLYNITGLTPLEQAARILENETRLTNFFLSLCKVEKECDEYLLNPRKIDLEPGVVYLGADGKAFVLYRPVEAAGQKYDPMELTHFVFRLIGQQMPRDSRILNVLSRQLLYGGSFSFAELEPKLKEKPVMEKIPEPVQEETPRYEERHPIQAKPYVPPKPVMEPPKPEIPKQEPVVPEPAQDNPFAQSGNPFAEVQPKNEKPQKENKKAEKKPEKKSGGLFGLFGGKKDKKKAGSEEQENPFQQKEEPPQAAQKAEMPRAQRPAPVSAPMQAPAAPKAEAGRTVLLSGSENGGTTKTMVMGSGTTGAGELYLVQKDTNQYIHVTHTNFHIGRAENIVDYTVQTRNHYLGNDHAYILLDGGNYYKRVIALALAVCFSASAYSCYYGVTQMRSERENLYLLDLAQAEQAEKTADYGTAQTLLQGAIQRQPGRADAYLQMAVLMYRTGDYQGAVNQLESAVSSGNLKENDMDAVTREKLHFIKGNCYIELQDYDWFVQN